MKQEQTGFRHSMGMLKLDLAVSAGLLFFFVSVGFYMSPTTGADTVNTMRQWVEPVVQMGPWGILAFIVVNNVVKALVVTVSGVMLGLPSLLFIAINGITIGSLAGAVGAKAGYVIVAAGLLPHGIIELLALVLATALGFSLGKEALFWMLRRESHLKAQFRNAFSIYLMVVLPLLVIAAVIEVTITPWLTRMVGG